MSKTHSSVCTNAIWLGFKRQFTNCWRYRYEIVNGSVAWEDAEEQIRKGGGSTVSVKASKIFKRKAGESAREIYDREVESKVRKKIKKGTESKRK